MPAKAGIYKFLTLLDSRLRGMTSWELLEVPFKILYRHLILYPVILTTTFCFRSADLSL